MKENMKVILSDTFTEQAFTDYFKDNVELYNGKQKGEFDYVIFPGGEDVNPRRYFNGKVPNDVLELCSWNDLRDDIEFSLFQKILRGEIKAKYVVGICRGLQLMNVAFGGTLHPNLYHPTWHPLTFEKKEFFDMWKPFINVNSIHHQGVKDIGTLDGKAVPIKIASWYFDGVPEILEWKVYDMDTKFLGVQFHPEFMRELPRFFEIVEKE